LGELLINACKKSKIKGNGSLPHHLPQRKTHWNYLVISGFCVVFVGVAGLPSVILIWGD
jgi:hypothetical protein